MKNLISFFFIFISLSVFGIEVTFQLNMQGFTVNPNGVSIAGDFQGWTPGVSFLTDTNADDIFEFTATLTEATTISYKFINGTTWAQEESVPSSCGVPNGFGGFNRTFVVPGNNIVLEPVCFSSCANCPAIVPQITAVFQVDMSNEIVSPNGVHLAGDFQGWNPTSILMNDMGGGLYEAQISVDQNTILTYKFVNGNDWNSDENPPLDCATDDGNGNTNRLFQTGTNNVIIGPVCFNQCSACVEPTPVLVTFRTDLSNETISPNGVYLVGSFNNWDTIATPMSQYAPNKFEAVVVLNSNQTVQYKIINGYGWSNQEIVPESCGIPNGVGGFDRSYTTTNQTMTTLEGNCFSGCGPCIIIPMCTLTFNLDLGSGMTGIIAAPEGVHVAGSFNNWDPTATPLTLQFGTTYSTTVTIPENELIQYKFLFGNAWGTEEVVPFECGVDDGSGNINRSFLSSAGIISLPIVCWSQCEPCPMQVEDLYEAYLPFPNPADDYVQLPSTLSSQSVQIIDALGRVMKLNNSFASQVIDISTWANGIYFIHTSNNNQTAKFFIQHEN
ncbi:MAG: T9SS type A sorting domain-containing protein [Bacteroidetes bacterium]|nr:T9SS type A sorting domain-containing protein [Bacteroidota bacterium]